MKRISTLLLASLLLTAIISCEKDNLETSENKTKNSIEIFNRTSQENLDFYDSIVALDTEDQKLVFATLSPKERNEIWHIKLKNFKDKNLLNNDQITFIDELSSELNENLFTNKDIQNSEKLDFIKNRKDYFFNKAKNLFGENEGWYLLTKIENINHAISKLDKLPSGGGGPIRSCECEKSRECTRLTGISLDGLSWEYGNCSNGGCYVQVYFGIWESDNTGRCSY